MDLMPLHGAEDRPRSPRSLGDTRAEFLDTRDAARAAQAGAPQYVVESWERSLRAAVNPGSRGFEWVETDPEHFLARAARLPLRRLVESVDGFDIGIVLSNDHARIVHRAQTGTAAGRLLDAIHLAPGFDYSEDAVGTNGVGTAIRASRPVYISGATHYQDRFENYACAGAPIFDPITGKPAGVIDLTCAARDASPILMSLAAQTAQLISEEIRGSAVARERGTLVVSVGNVVSRPNTARVSRPLRRTPQRTTPLSSAAECAVAHSAVDALALGQQMKSSAWRLARRELASILRRGEVAAVLGEAGTGKVSLIREVFESERRGAALLEVDAAALEAHGSLAAACAAHPIVTEPETTHRLASPGASDLFLLFRNVQHFPAGRLNEVATLLRRPRLAGRHVSIVLTADAPSAESPELQALLPYVAYSVAVPPLRERSGDFAAIVTQLLARLSPDAPWRVSPEALRALAAGYWPGNLTQLADALAHAVELASRRDDGTIAVADLASHAFYAGSAALTPLEREERQAIIQALHRHSGNRTAAAQYLGCSRATLYRKLARYGLD